MNFYEVTTQLKKGELAPIYLVTGKQTYLMEQLKKQFVKMIPEADQTMNLASYDMDSTPLSEAMNDAMSAPFFGEHRLVIINNPLFLTGEKGKGKIDHATDELINYVQNPLPSTILVVMAPYEKLDARKKIVKMLKKQAVWVDLQEVNENETKKYVGQYLNHRGYQIDQSVMESLIQRTDGQLSAIMNDLPKLMIYCQKEKQITRDSVANLVTKTLNQNIFTLVDLVLKKQTTSAVSLYQELLMDGQSSIQINAVLLGQFRLLLQVMVLKNYGYSQGKLASSLKVHPYRVKLALQTSRHYQFKDLKRAFLGLTDIERQLKSTNESPELLFEMFMLKFA
ncbi:DNA polymerase III subunit delta [Lactobacillus sp. Sy-1]|uniref:DNA polymerase III subunit delta n=1 Tax=Lactobacillus sp. Sy-1 TaxID=2109645 RepID=UPI001C59470F|nr:DNA polymerase III subunit delta [Lactobacillus sp. Sy-1]MBW1605451.1 DNA polymerase III subunit delta [Lactobacillus sp. Sy-1]